MLEPGDVFNGVPHGGGGFGDPIERDPLRVQGDVRQGFVSLDYALRVYGVVLDPRHWRFALMRLKRGEMGSEGERLAAGGRGLALKQVHANWRE